MFENIGNKLKSFANVLIIIGILAFIICAALSAEQENWLILLIGIGGFISIWLSALLISGFGHLILTAESILSVLSGQNTEDSSSDNPADELPNI